MYYTGINEIIFLLFITKNDSLKNQHLVPIPTPDSQYFYIEL